MSEFESLKSKPEAKRLLKGVTFDFKGAHISYTDGSQGGAASNLNEPFLLKSADIKDISEDQKEILKKINENSTPLDKSGDVNKDEGSPQVDEEASLRKEDGGLPKTYDNNSLEKDNTMSEIEDIQKQLDAVKVELRVTKAVNLVNTLGLEDEQVVTFSKALAALPEEDAVAVVDIFKAVKAIAAEEVEKSKEVKKEAEENPLAKSLQDESGNEEESEDLSFVEKVLKAQDEQKGDK